MKNPMQTGGPSGRKPDTHSLTCNTMTELTDTELQAVAGGINPQPLPPRAPRNPGM